MSNAPIDILAIDLATTCGWARGFPGATPACGIARFGSPNASNNAIFGNALKWMSDILKAEPRPHSIILEAMLPPQALKGETSRATRDRLAGLHGIVRGVAHCRGIYDISDVSVLVVRQHFCGNRGCGKQAVFDKCRKLGWPVTDLNESDACAAWHFACALVDPKVALEVSPLFGKRPMRVSA